MRLSRYEQETVINFNEEEDVVTIYTASKIIKKQLERKGFVQYREPIRNRETNKEITWFFSGPKNRFTFNLRKPRTLTAEQREKHLQQATINFNSKNNKHDK